MDQQAFLDKGLVDGMQSFYRYLAKIDARTRYYCVSDIKTVGSWILNNHRCRHLGESITRATQCLEQAGLRRQHVLSTRRCPWLEAKLVPHVGRNCTNDVDF